jgi:DNA polymerase III epsilon subunit-like protein
MRQNDVYFSVDIESSGPIPGEFSMLSLGACLVSDPAKNFYVELQPTSDEFVPRALEVSGFNLQALKKSGTSPTEAMEHFVRWVQETADGGAPVFVGFNGCFDWQFVNWYCVQFAGINPFGFGGVDIKSFYMGLAGKPWSATTSSQLPQEFRPDSQQTHNALDDAKAQASIFRKLLSAAENK